MFQKYSMTIVTLLASAMMACGSDVQDEPAGAPILDVGSGPDVNAEIGTADTKRISADADADVQAQPGEFLAPCNTNIECNSGHCVETRASKKCSKVCTESCPTDMRCTANQTPGGDIVYICMDPFVSLCQPCLSPIDCSASGDYTCAPVVGIVADGSFCLPKCTTSANCPMDFSCVARAGGSVCVPKSSACFCTPRSTAKQAFTVCLGGGFNCPGKRMCAPQGLTACEPVIKQEVCNLKDDDCNGKTDDGLCDDGNVCTEDACNPDGSCKHLIMNGTSCEDDNICTQASGCVDGKCTGGNPLKCDDGNPCTTDSCKPITGCVSENNKLPCNDNNQCTDNDTCGAGACSVTTPHPCNDGNPCTTDLCKPDKGCQFTPLTDPGAGKGACPSDGNSCTEDKCQGGACKHVPIPGC